MAALAPPAIIKKSAWRPGRKTRRATGEKSPTEKCVGCGLSNVSPSPDYCATAARRRRPNIKRLRYARAHASPARGGRRPERSSGGPRRAGAPARALAGPAPSLGQAPHLRVQQMQQPQKCLCRSNYSSHVTSPGSTGEVSGVVSTAPRDRRALPILVLARHQTVRYTELSPTRFKDFWRD